ncbi:MAG: tetratricopeptide repeat protein [Holosporales bacterium]|jgi:hypothetical protein|nr:tetratricopeptide repeat protein [Holosporales bacterium]
MSDGTDDLFSEIQEELRQEQLVKFWKTYKKPLVIGVTTVVLGIVAYSSWNQRTQRKAEESTAELIEIAHTIARGDTSQAFLRLTNLERNASRKTACVTRIIRCCLTLESSTASDEEKAQASALLYELAKNPRLERIWADLALLKAVYYALLMPHQVQQVDTYLADLATAGRPYRITALELSAACALQKGNKTQARSLFEQILREAGASSMAKERATLMLQSPALRL